MTDDAPKPPPDKTFRWMIIMLVAVVVVVGGYLLYRWALRNPLDKRYAAIRAAGDPVTLEELADWYPDTTIGMNGANVYLQAFSKYSDKTRDNENLPVVNTAELPELGEPISPAMLVAIREYLAENDEALKLLHEAATYEECKYPINMSAGYAALLSHLAPCRQAARLFNLKTILKSEDQDAAGVTQTVLDSLAVGNSLKNEPLLVSQLVRIACNAISQRSFERVLSRIELTDAQLVEVMNGFKNAENPEGMTRAFAGERCTGIAMFENPDMLAGTGVANMPSASFLQLTGLLDMNAKEYVDIMNMQISALQEGPDNIQKRFAEIDQRIANLPRLNSLFASSLLPALSAAAIEDMNGTARLRCAATAAAVERYRLAHGEFPAQLSDLVPEYISEIPTDPFSTDPIRYKKTDEGCVVYSIGQDGKDDGGVEYETYVGGRGRGERLDLPFRLLKKKALAEE